jgi:hypothetical protein
MANQPPSPESRLRAVLPDAVSGRTIYLFKACSELRLTYEIRLATFMALQKGMTLTLDIRAHTRLSPDLAAFVAEHGVTVIRKS